MKSAAAGLLCLTTAVLWVGVRAQEKHPDPRVGLKAGLKDAGEAARNLDRVASLPKPDGFFDPKSPAGEPTPAERERRTPAAEAAGARGRTESEPAGRAAPGSVAAA